MHIETRPVISVLVTCILQLAERFPSLPEAGKLRAQTNSVNSAIPHRIEKPNQFLAATPKQSRFGSGGNFLEQA